jgi:hypothetical protein
MKVSDYGVGSVSGYVPITGDPDPGGSTTYGSNGSESGFGKYDVFKSILQTISGTCLSLARGVSSLAGDWTASSRVISLVLKRKQNMSGKTRIRLIRKLEYYSFYHDF